MENMYGVTYVLNSGSTITYDDVTGSAVAIGESPIFNGLGCYLGFEELLMSKSKNLYSHILGSILSLSFF